MAINWNYNNSNEQLKRAVRNYNAKIRREIKKGATVTPAKISLKTARESINSRADFNRTIRSLGRIKRPESFETVTNKNNVTATKYEIRETQIETRTINARRTRQRNKYNIDLSTREGLQQATTENLVPKKFDFEKIHTPSDLDKRRKANKFQLRSDYLQIKNQRLKLNYLNSIKENLGDSEKAKRLYEIIDNLSPQQIARVQLDRDPIMNVAFTSDPLPSEMIVDTLLPKWESYYNQVNQ